MAQLLQLQRRQGIALQLRAHGPHPLAVPSPGQGGIQLHQHLLQVIQGRQLRRHQGAQLLQHDLLGLPLLALQLADAVAQRNHRLGLDEHGAARGGAVVHQARQLRRGPRLHRQHGPAVALRHHGVLEQGREAAHQPIEAIATLLAYRRQLPPQLPQGGAGAVRHPTALLQAEVEALLQFRQSAQLLQQVGAHGPQGRIVDLAPQPPGRRQGGGHRQQVVAGGGAPLGANLQGAAEIGHPLKTQPPFGEAIEGDQLGGLRQQPTTGLRAGGQGQLQTALTAEGGAGEAGEVLSQPRPLQQLKRLPLDRADGSVLHHPGTHPRATGIGSAPMLEGSPSAGS